jgi:hypothetical protein
VAHSTSGRLFVGFLLLIAAAVAVYSWRDSSPRVHAQAADFLHAGTVVAGRAYDFKFPGTDNPMRRTVKRVVQGWIEVDAWTTDPGLPPLEPVPRRWLNASALEYIQDVRERR